MLTVPMTAKSRTEVGKGSARQLRQGGRLPAVLYSQGHSRPLSIDPRGLQRILQHSRGENVLIELKIEDPQGDTQVLTILRETQRDPTSGVLLHADFFEVTLGTVVRVKVPIRASGAIPAGVQAGGIMETIMHEIELEGLPAQIPEVLELNTSGLHIGQALQVKDLVLPEGTTVLGPPHQTIFTIAAPVSEAKLEEMLTTASAEESKAPEVLKERKPEEPGEQPEAKKPQS